MLKIRILFSLRNFLTFLPSCLLHSPIYWQKDSIKKILFNFKVRFSISYLLYDLGAVSASASFFFSILFSLLFNLKFANEEGTEGTKKVYFF